ncbi:MAG: hypothetical protein V3T23_01675 [Nitrososphaerales archaeon]
MKKPGISFHFDYDIEIWSLGIFADFEDWEFGLNIGPIQIYVGI